MATVCGVHGCGRLDTYRGRCAAHRRSHSPTNHQRDNAERTRRTATVHAWVAQRGWVCPGWQRDPHPATDLTADHVDAVGAGGHPHGELVVLCTSCNSRKGARR